MVGATSWAQARLVEWLGASILPDRGFVTDRATFAAWAEGKKPPQLLMDRFYREVRERTGILMEGGEPVGGQFNLDHDYVERSNHLAAPPPLPHEWWELDGEGCR